MRSRSVTAHDVFQPSRCTRSSYLVIVAALVTIVEKRIPFRRVRLSSSGFLSRGVENSGRGVRKRAMAFENREDTNLLFLNLVDDPIVSDQDFPHVVTANLRDSTPGERLLGCAPRATP